MQTGGEWVGHYNEWAGFGEEQRTNVHRFHRQTIEEEHVQVQVQVQVQEEDLHWFLLADATLMVAVRVRGGVCERVLGACHMHSRDTSVIDSGGWGWVEGDDRETRDTGDVHRHPRRTGLMHIAAFTPSTRK